MGDTVDSLSDRLNSFIEGPKQPEPPPIYKPRPFDEAEPMKPQRMPPVSPAQAVNFNDYKGKPNDTYWYNDALNKAKKQYDKESGPYQEEKDKYDAAMRDWRGRKKVWDDAENQLVENSKEPYNKVSQYLADPKGKEQLSWNNGALVLPYVGTALGGTYLNNMARGPWSKIGLGGLELAAGNLLRNSVAATQPSKYENPDAHYQSQMWQNALEGTGAGMATSSIRAALMKGKDAQAENKPDDPPQKPPTQTPDQKALISGAKGLGAPADISSADAKAYIEKRRAEGLSKTEAVKLRAALSHAAERPNEQFVSILKKLTPGVAIPLGLLGLGVGLAGSSDEADAATHDDPVARAMNIATSNARPKQEPESRNPDAESTRMFDQAGQALTGAANMGSYFVPGLREARMGKDLIDAYNPSDEDLAHADYWSRGVEGMDNPKPEAPESEPAPAPKPKPKPEKHGSDIYDYPAEAYARGGSVVPLELIDHLPEHEKALLHDPKQAHETSKHLIPYLRAGAEAHNRGEDFFGGTEAYEKQLHALKHYYCGGQVEEAPQLARRAEGGRVAPHHKKVHSISEAFKQRLDGKHKLIASLEKAHAKGAKVGDKLSKEREEAKRIAEHLEKIKNYA